MKQVFSLFVIISLVIALAACSGRGKSDPLGPDAPPEAVPNISGKYVVNGVDPLGIEYSGHLTITAGDKNGEYELQWIVVGSIQTGTGILEGNTLKVHWQSVESATGDSKGTATYTITEDGELYGTRTVEGHTGEGSETAYPNK